MTALPLPVPAAVEIGLEAGGPGPTVRGLRWDWTESDFAMLLLHAFGADLDDLRWLANRIVPAGVSVLSIDLPGHGLSDGDGLVPADGSKAICAALAALGREAAGVAAVLAQGHSAGLLLQTELHVRADHPVAAILLDPRPLVAGQRCADCWRLVPKLLVVPADSTHARFAAEIVHSTNAWTLQADLHGFGGPQRSEIAETQITSLVLKFALEVAAYELAGRRAAGSA
jgi:alpha-beta hydrolase superfamily lysophospholipase